MVPSCGGGDEAGAKLLTYTGGGAGALDPPFRSVAVGPVALGTAGSLLVLTAGWVLAQLPGLSTGAVAVPGVIVAVRGLPHARLYAFIAVVLGLFMVVAAWRELLRVTRHTGEVGPAWRCAASWNLPLLFAPPLFSLDAWAYAAQGALDAHGFSPYQYGPEMLTGTTAQPMLEAMDQMWRSTPTPYGPLQIEFSDLLAHWSSNPLALVAAHRFEGVVGLLLLAWSVPRLAAAAGGRPALASALVVGSPLVLVAGVAGIHNDLLVAGLAAAGGALAADRPWMLGAAVVGLGAGVKIPALAACLAVALISLPVKASFVSRLQRLVAVAAIAVAVVLGLGLVTGLGAGWLHVLGVPSLVLPSFAPLGLVPGSFRGVGPLLPLLAGAVLALKCPTGTTQGASRAVAATLLLGALFAGPAYPWYFLWALPWVAVLPLAGKPLATLVGASVALCLLSTLGDVPPNTLAAYATLSVAAVAVSRLGWGRDQGRAASRPPASVDQLVA